MPKSVKAELWLLLVSVLWGLTFPLIHDALLHISASFFVTARFLIAGIVFCPFVFGQLKKTSKTILANALALGALNTIAYFCQTKGLETIQPSRSAFITGVSVILVPFLMPLFKLGKPKLNDVYCVLLCLAGLYILTGATLTGFSIGDSWTLIGALATASTICLIQRLSKKSSQVLLLVFYQIIFTIPVPILFTSTTDYSHLFNLTALIAILFCAVFATNIVFYLQLRYQRDTSATRAAIIYALEPVFATFFSYFIVHEPITPHTLIGGTLIFCSIAITDIVKLLKNKKN